MIDERNDDDDLLLVSKHLTASSNPMTKRESEAEESQFTLINNLNANTQIPRLLQPARTRPYGKLKVRRIVVTVDMRQSSSYLFLR
jgi:hypothetical protein